MKVSGLNPTSNSTTTSWQNNQPQSSTQAKNRFEVIKLATHGHADEPKIQRYLELFHVYPGAFGPKGDWKQGEMEIIDDPQEMARIQELVKQRLLSKGLPENVATDRSRVGIISEDAYWIWVRDAVILPTGANEIYNRFMHKKSLLNDDGGTLVSGAGTLAVFPDQKILLNVIYRHATRSWEIELPRGGVNKGETLEEAAHREVKEETGYGTHAVNYLGTMVFDSGSTASLNALFHAEIAKEGEHKREDEEAIVSLLALSKQEIINGFVTGEIEVAVNRKTIKARCRDPLLSQAILIAEAKGYFNQAL